MRKISLSVSFILLGIFAEAQSEKVIKSSVKKAVVYLQGAQLYSSETVSLAAGNSKIIFEGVSPYLVQNTIQASGKGNIVITESRFIQKYKEKTIVVNDNRYIKMMELLQDSMEEISYQITDANNRHNTLETEKKMLMGNRIINNQTQKDSLPLLRDGMNFLRERLNNINGEQLKLSKELRRLEKIKTRMHNRMNELSLLSAGKGTEEKNAEPVNMIEVDVYAESAVNVTITIAYFVNNAGWVPYYELHGDANEKSIRFRQMASIYQNTGTDWKDVQMVLSTATPGGYTQKPELNTWFVGYFQQTESLKRSKNLSAPQVITQKKDIVTIDDMKADKEEDVQIYDMPALTSINRQMALTEYELKMKYNVPPDGQMHYVLVQNRDLSAEYYYSVVPKLDIKAYLMARVTGWEDLDLVAGNAKIYFDGNLAGTTALNPNETGDTLLVNMGRDNGLTVLRKKLKDENKDRIIHDELVKKQAFEIIVRNTKALPILLTIEDQIPVVQTGVNNVSVKLKESSGAALDELSGKLTWNLKIPAKENRKLQFSFTVTGPKTMLLSGL